MFGALSDPIYWSIKHIINYKKECACDHIVHLEIWQLHVKYRNQSRNELYSRQKIIYNILEDLQFLLNIMHSSCGQDNFTNVFQDSI